MEIDKEYEHEQMRKKLWCDVYASYVRQSNPSYVPSNVADEALKEFDSKFQKPQPRPIGLGCNLR